MIPASATRPVGRDSIRCRPVLLSLLTAALFSSCGFPRRDEGASPAAAAPVFVEAHNFISDRPGMSRLDVGVRIPLSFFVFVRARPESGAAPFVARTDVAVEILDRTRASTARNILRREITSPDQSHASTPEDFLEEMFSFDLAPGDYVIATEVSDLESSRRFIDKSGNKTLKNFSGSTLEVSDLLFLTASADSGPVTPASFGGDLPFGRRADGYLEFLSPAPVESIRASFAIRAAQSDRDARSSPAPDSFRAVAISRSRFLAPVKGEEGFGYRVIPPTGVPRYSLWLSGIGDTLPEGAYELETRISGGSSSTTLRHPFRIRWIDMPRSLRSIQMALEALRYIASDSEMNDIRSASRERQKDRFTLFWKRRDPTPATAFNERMAEFYRRVDYAAENFGSFREPNGMKTDRGKAYILYGPPGKIERSLRPGSDPQEVWMYPNLHKRLVFIDREHHGDYKLFETGDI